MATRTTQSVLKRAIFLAALGLACVNLGPTAALANEAPGVEGGAADGLANEDTSSWKRKTNWRSGPKFRKRVKKRRRKSVRKRRPRRQRSTVAAITVPANAPGEILVAFPAGTSDALIEQLATSIGVSRLAVTDVALLNARLVKFGVSRGQLRTTLQQLQGDGRIISAQPNFIYTLAAPAQYSIEKLKLNLAREIGDGSGISIAIVDSGVQPDHPSLAGHSIAQFDALDGGAGKIDSHGTAIASIIAARSGIQSIVPNAKLLSARTFAYSKSTGRTIGETFHLLRGLDWAVGQKAKVLNLSFTGPEDPLLKLALSASYDQGVIAVAAAGNNGSRAPAAYPAAYENVVAVTATDHRDRLYRRANRGAYIHVAAPGVKILSASGVKGYGFASGTSMAAAHVSAVAGLLLQKNAESKPQEIINRLTQTARDLGKTGRDSKFGYGLIDIERAVSAEN